MAGKWKSYSVDLKAKVGLWAIGAEAAIAELITKYGKHLTVIHSWKYQVFEGVAGFSKISRR